MNDKSVYKFLYETLEGVPKIDLKYIFNRIDVFEQLVMNATPKIIRALNENAESQLCCKQKLIELFLGRHIYHRELMLICDKIYDNYVYQYKRLSSG
jgi:hypothetical protein